jgi:hypothetical protein
MCRQTIYVAFVSFMTGVLGAILLTYGATALKYDLEPSKGIAAAVVIGCILVFAYLVYSLVVVVTWRQKRNERVTQHVTLSEESL